MKPHTKKELIKQLKELPEEKTPKIKSDSAMCYCPAPNEEKLGCGCLNKIFGGVAFIIVQFQNLIQKLHSKKRNEQ